MSATPTPAPVRVPVWQVAKESYRSVFFQPIVFFKLAWFPALLFFVLTGSLFYLSFKALTDMAPILSTQGAPQKLPRGFRWLEAASLLGTILLIALVNAFAVRWHKFQLRGEIVSGTTHMFNEEWKKFTAYALLIYSPHILWSLFRIIVEFIPGIEPSFGGIGGAILGAALWVLWMGFLVYAFGCSLIFPAAAYGQPIAWRQAWRYLHGNFWRLIACTITVGLISFFTCLPIIFLFMVPMAVVGPFLAWATGALTVFELVFVALFASILCSFYRRIVLVATVTG